MLTNPLQHLCQPPGLHAPLTNLAAMQVLLHNAEQDRASGLLTEALMSAIAQSDPEAKRRLQDFLEKQRPPR
jgi:(methylthio)acryloyl-CoA hydratase